MSIGWFVDARRARRVEGVPDGAAPREETRVVRETRATYLDRGTVGEGVGVRHAELDDVRAGLVQDRERLLGGVEVGIARADEGHERATGCASSGQRRSRRWTRWPWQCPAAARTGAARAVRRIATAERVASLTPARGEAAKAVAAIVVQARTIGAAARGRDSNCRGVRGRTSPAVPCRCADACVALGGGLGERGAPAHAVSIAATALDESRLDKSKIG